MPDHAAPYEFSAPLATAQAALTLLQGNPAAIEPLLPILRAARSQLQEAQGDIARAQAVSRLLFALEASAVLPSEVAAALLAAHRPRTRSVEMFSSEQARGLIAQLDALPGNAPLSAAAPSPTAMPTAGGDADPAAIVLRLLSALPASRARLSVQAAAQLDADLAAYQRALTQARTPAERLAATQHFLDAVRANREAYALLGAAYVMRDAPIAPPAGEAMNAAWASTVQQMILLSGLRPEATLSAAITPDPTEKGALSGDADGPPAPVTYHSDVRFPRQVSIFDEAVPLWVRLAVDAQPASVTDTPVSITFSSPQPELVTVICRAEGFLLDNEDIPHTTRTLLVSADQTSQWAVFLLTPHQLGGGGERLITLDFLHRGRPAGTASFTVDVRIHPPVERTAPGTSVTEQQPTNALAVMLRLGQAGAPSPDFILRITLNHDQRLLSYTLHSPTGRGGYGQDSLGSCRLNASPRDILQHTLNRLSQFSRQRSTDLSERERNERIQQIRSIGWQLSQSLTTEPLRQALKAMQQLNAQTTTPLSLLLLTDDPWIPWEMLLPEDQDHDDSFLCAQFHLTRWLAGPPLPAPLAVQRAAVVIPKSSLTATKTEKDYFNLERPAGVQFDGRWLTRVSDVTATLGKAEAQWLHFACHGDFDAANANDAELILEGARLTPTDLSGPVGSGIQKSLPLVMLNACNSAEIGPALSGMGGWAQSFVRNGATAFLGSLWEVNDTLAAEFAVNFYRTLFSGQTLGAALQSARRHIRDRDPANSTWLAYSLYADPNGRVSGEQ